jgi:MFS family permease
MLTPPVIDRAVRYAGLLRQHDYRQLWLAQTVSQFGTQVTVLALPLVAILVLNASAFEVAVLGALEFLPFLFFTLPAGVWVDRLSKRSILMTADLGRAAVLALIPLTYLAGVLAMWQLYVVAFVAGIGTVFFDIAYQAVLPELVSRDRLAEGNSRLEVTRSSAQVLGPGIGGFLVGQLSAPIAILADGISYLGSAAFLLRIRAASSRPGRPVGSDVARPRLIREIAEGLRYFADNPYLRASSAAVVTLNVAAQVTGSIFLVFVVRELGLRPEVLGITLSVGSIGLVAGAAGGAGAGRRLGVGPVLIGAFAFFCIANFLMAITPRELAVPFLATAWFLQGVSVMFVNVNGVTLRQAVTPDELQGRVNATGRWINWSLIPPASILGGVLATAIGLRATILAGAVLGLLALPWLVFSPIRRLREMPTIDAPISPAPHPPSGAPPSPVAE